MFVDILIGTSDPYIGEKSWPLKIHGHWKLFQGKKKINKANIRGEKWPDLCQLNVARNNAPKSESV